jgi:peptide-methionine (S)-S-oxide reductase
MIMCMSHKPESDTIVLSGGCFWCTEAIFKRLKGINQVIPGYTGGTIPNPTYEQICTGNTGHAESNQIIFKPAEISLATILEVFWHTHDPTSLNRQGNDIGSQYRSAIFYKNDAQKEIVLKSKLEISLSHEFSQPIMTEILPVSNFYQAEDYHLNYFDNHQNMPYCNIVIGPKIHKLMDKYSASIKPEFKI